jgi:hypothetical protein
MSSIKKLIRIYMQVADSVLMEMGHKVSCYVSSFRNIVSSMCSMRM